MRPSDEELLDVVRGHTSAQRRRTVALTAAAAIGVIVLGGIAVVADRDTNAPQARRTGSIESGVPVPDPHDPTCSSAPREQPVAAPTGDSIVAAQQEWVDRLPLGAPPLTPWWHDGVLHVLGEEFRTPYPISIEVAGDTVLVGGQPGFGRRRSEWALVREGDLEPLPLRAVDAGLSVDGRIAFWDTDPRRKQTSLVTWDVVTHKRLASHNMSDPSPHPMKYRVHLWGIDADGIAYLLDTSKLRPVTRWDVRADTLESTTLTWDESRSYSEKCPPLSDLWRGFESGYVSPDGTREVFTGSAPGDVAQDCCTTRLRVRPVGDASSVEPEDITMLQLPEGIPTATLWHDYSDRGIWSVWWESDETVLLDAVIGGHSYLVRCSATDGTCERVFDLGPNISEGITYWPTWETDWTFARSPVAD